MKYYLPTSLLSTRNAKIMKGEKYGYTTYGLSLSPFNLNSLGKNICPMATVGCASACLNGSGKGSMENVKKGRRNKTEFFLHNREFFLTMLYSEIAQIEMKHKIMGGKFCIRLNMTSDLSFEKFKIKDNKNIFELFPKVQFYDYSKNHLRFKYTLPKNYRLIFSRSETNENIGLELIKKGFNMAVVFDELPKNYKGYKVIDGDISDTRFLDENGVIVGLKYKKLTGKGVNNQLAFESGFAIRTEQKLALPKQSKLKKAA